MKKRVKGPRDGDTGDDGETFRLLVEKSPIPMAVTDLDGRFRFLNDRFRAVFGYSEADLPDLDAWWRRAYPDESYRAEILSVWRDSQANDGHWDGSDFKNRDYRVTCADGSVRIMKIGGTKIASKRLFLFLEITARIRAEQEASRLREQLFQAHKMEAIGRLAAGVAHDFNNHITSIMGYSALIRMERGLPADVQDGLEQIEKTARRAAELTKRLLAFSRKQDLQPAVLDLHELIRNLEKMLRRMIGENVALVSSLKAVKPSLLADPGQLDQVLVNLAVNARDAMPEGGVLTVATRNTADEDGCGDCIELTVSDTGCGMDAEVQAHLFEPFFTTKERGKGTGLGLSTVYAAVMQSGGRIAVRSEPGRGSAFVIRFLCVRQDAAVPSPAPAAADRRGGTETILLVEDEGFLLDMTARTLENLGYRVIRKQDPREALALLAGPDGLGADLLLTDVVMPGLNGRELAERVLQAHAGMKVLFISGYPVEDILPRTIRGREVEFLQKPFLPDDLAGKVRGVLDG